MAQLDHDDKRIRHYLLAELSEEDRTRFEEWLLADDVAFQQVLAVEEDLIEEYVRDELAPVERERVERFLLASPEGRRKAEFAEVLRRNEPTIWEEAARRPPAPRWSAWRALVRPQRPAVQWLLAAAALLGLSASPWLILVTKGLRHQVAQLASAERALQQENETLKAQLARQAEALEKPFPDQSGVAVPPLSAPPRPLSFLPALLLEVPGGDRAITPDTQDTPTLILPPGDYGILIQLLLEGGKKHNIYRAHLRTAGGQEVKTLDDLQAYTTGYGPTVVVLSLPSNLLTGGGYSIRLSGLTARQEYKDVATYYFKVKK